MKLSIATIALAAGSAAAFAPATTNFRSATAVFADVEASTMVEDPDADEEPVPEPVDIFSTPEMLPGVVAPMGFFDPLNFAAQADAATMRRYREAELTHGRVGMLAVLGFLAGEYVAGSSFLFDAQVKGAAITHLNQIPPAFWILLTVGIGASESKRLNIGWVSGKTFCCCCCRCCCCCCCC